MIQNCFTSASLLFSSPSSTNHFTEYQSTSSSKPLVFQNILHRMQGCCWGEGAGRRRAHSDRALNRQHSSAQALAAISSYTPFLILYSRNHSKVTSFSDPGPRQAPSSRSHLLICYYCQALLPGQSIAEGKDLQQRLFCRQPLPAASASYRAKLIAGVTQIMHSNSSSIVRLWLHQILSQFLCLWQVFTYKISITYNPRSAATM